MPTQIGFPIVDGCFGEHRVGGLEELGLAYINVTRLGEINRFKIIGPIPVRRYLLQIGLRHLVVVLLWIAKLHASAGGLGQRSFQSHDLLGVAGSLPGASLSSVSIFVT